MRYLRLYLFFLRFSFSRAMEFRVDFYFRVVMDCIYYLTSIAFFKIIYNHTNLLADWTESQVMVFVGVFCMLDALEMTFFNNNFWWLPHFINRGDMDYYLVRPVSSVFFLTLREFAANSFMNLVFALGIFIWALVSHFGEFSFLTLAYGLCMTLLGLVISYSLHLTVLVPSFWTQSAMGLHQIFWIFNRIRERPDRIYRGGFRFIFTSFLPFAAIASFPARLIVEGFSWPIFLQLLGVAIGFFILSQLCWGFGVRRYTSASS